MPLSSQIFEVHHFQRPSLYQPETRNANMNFSNSLLAFSSFVILTILSATVRGIEIAPYTMFNHGLVESSRACTTEEFNRVMSAMDNASGRRRELNTHEPEEDNRRLRRCGCRYCHYSEGCANDINRRKLSNLRRDQSLDTCDAEIVAINNTLNSLTTAGLNLSPACMALVNSERTFTCRERVPCEVEFVNLWDANSNEMLIEAFPQHGGVICRSARLTFEAVPLFDFGNVQFTLSGPTPRTSRTDWNAPYFMHGNNGYSGVNGFNFGVGNYTLIVSANDPAKAKTITFQVNDC